MALSSIHQHGISSWQACQSNQVSTSTMEGSGGWFSPPSLGSSLTSGSQKVTLLPCHELLGDLGCLSKEQLCRQLLLWLLLWLLLQLLLQLLLWLLLRLLLWLWEQVYGASLIPRPNLSVSFLSTLAASSTLWQAVLISQRASLYESLLLGLDWQLSICPCASLAVAGYTC